MRVYQAAEAQTGNLVSGHHRKRGQEHQDPKLRSQHGEFGYQKTDQPDIHEDQEQDERVPSSLRLVTRISDDAPRFFISASFSHRVVRGTAVRLAVLPSWVRASPRPSRYCRTYQHNCHKQRR